MAYSPPPPQAYDQPLIQASATITVCILPRVNTVVAPNPHKIKYPIKLDLYCSSEFEFGIPLLQKASVNLYSFTYYHGDNWLISVLKR